MSSQPNLISSEQTTQKIAWFENADILGGAELFSLDMLSSVHQNITMQTEIDVYISGENNEFQSRLEKISQSLPEYITLNCIVTPLPSLKFNFQGIKKYIQTVWNIRKILKHKKYQTLYCNTVRTGILLGSVLSTYSMEIKSIFMVHDYTFPQKLQKFILPKFSKIFACSHPIRQYLMSSGIEAKKIITIENGVDPALFQNISPIKTLPRKIGMIGRITRWKGQRTILSAFASLHKKYPEAILSFYGEADEKEENQVFLSELKKRVHLEGLAKHVFFEGFTPLTTAMEKCDVIVHASEENEPFGRTPIEGAMAKRLLMISNIGTPAQIFEENKTAFFFDAGNVTSARNTLESILNIDGNMTSNILENSFTMVNKNFTLEQIAKRFWSNLI